MPRRGARSLARRRTTSTHGTGPSRQRPTLANPEGGGLVRDGPAAQDAGPLPGGREQGWCTSTHTRRPDAWLLGGWERRWCCRAQGRSRVVLLPLSQAGQGSAGGGKRTVGAAGARAAGIAELLCGDRRCLLGRRHTDCLPVCSSLCVAAKRRGMSMVFWRARVHEEPQSLGRCGVITRAVCLDADTALSYGPSPCELVALCRG